MKLLLKYLFLFLIVCAIREASGQSSNISILDPDNGYSGQLISLKGEGLAGFDRVFFGNIEGEIISVADQLVEVKPPAGTPFDNISLLNTSTGLYYYSEKDFYLTFKGESGIAPSNFDAQVDVDAFAGLYDITIADLDGDQKNDIISANQESNFPSIYFNNSTPGNIDWTPIASNVDLDPYSASSISSLSYHVTSGDITGNGKPDLVFTEATDATIGTRLFIIGNNSSGPGNFSRQQKVIALEGVSTKRVIIKDLDLDGKPEIIVSSENNNKIYILVNNTALTTFGPNPPTPTIIELTVDGAQRTSGLEVEDLNGDGKAEIITNPTQNENFFIASNQSTPGNFSFESFEQITFGEDLVNVKVADLNNDNKPDIIVTFFDDDAIAIFPNSTAGVASSPSFETPIIISSNLFPWGLDVGDMDGDGDLDILIATIGSTAINLFENQGENSFDFVRRTLPVTFINRNIRAADMDGDSKPDIVFASVESGGNGINKLSVLRNQKCIIQTITPSGPINVCTGNSITLETQAMEGVTYHWLQDGDTVKSSTDNFIELASSAQSGEYSVEIDANIEVCAGNPEPVSVTITDSNTLTSAIIDDVGSICTGESLFLQLANAVEVNADSLVWHGPQGFTEAGDQVEVVDFNISKAGRYSVDVYSGSCIVETVSTIVEITNAPNFALNGSGTYCKGATIELSVSPSTGAIGYQWFNGNTLLTGETNNSYTPTETGNYFAKVAYNTSCSPINTDTAVVNILAQPQISFTFPSEACTGNSLSFTDESVVDDNAIVNYSWSFGDGNVSTERNPTHIYNSSGTFDVSLEITYDGFTTCTSELSQSITINGELNFSINSSSTAICEGDSSVLSVDNPFNTYNWSTGETSSSIIVREAGDYSVTVTDANGCEGTSEITVTSAPSPTVELNASNTVISPNDTITLNATGLANYIWSPDSAIIRNSSDEVQMVISNSTTVTVEGTNSSGCFGSASIQIRVEESNIGDVIVPEKFFSPNNDGIADSWKIEEISNYPQCGIEIYDQTGNKIYEAKPYNNDWQGTSNGQPIPDGVYYFVIRCDDAGLVKSGSITLLR
ncbi:hypothetical protein GCM10027429_02210 [Marivirga atlantica]|jgi:gliding motility-associated-like protein|uniref:VCBS repeat-containing protein n=1 Tax=Marivirga atlantica TaxID=1548457 RepID=A0A937DD45_9BACT|nr:FG-GAP-like repeat-containing protein [Marivirga atlantica]MBL0763832.1 VCBS repeat-containing protein [Marivirga atlantica]